MRKVTLAEIYLLYFAVVTSDDEQNGTFNKLLLQPILRVVLIKSAVKEINRYFKSN